MSVTYKRGQIYVYHNPSNQLNSPPNIPNAFVVNSSSLLKHRALNLPAPISYDSGTVPQKIFCGQAITSQKPRLPNLQSKSDDEESTKNDFLPLEELRLFQLRSLLDSCSHDTYEVPPAFVVEILISNIVSSFISHCHLNLRQIAMEGRNVEFRREKNMLTMRLRRPQCTASVWSSGKVVCTGTTRYRLFSEVDSRIGARKIARSLQKLGNDVKFCNFKIVNVMGSCNLNFAIDMLALSSISKMDKSFRFQYEPELHPGATVRIDQFSSTMKVFTTGNITVTAPSIAQIESAVQLMYSTLYQCRRRKDLTFIRTSQNKRLKICQR